MSFLGTLLQIGSGCRPKIEGLIQPGLHPAHQEDRRLHQGFLPSWRIHPWEKHQCGLSKKNRKCQVFSKILFLFNIKFNSKGSFVPTLLWITIKSRSMVPEWRLTRWRRWPRLRLPRSWRWRRRSTRSWPTNPLSSSTDSWSTTTLSNSWLTR